MNGKVKTIFESKYARTLSNGRKESWGQACGRVAEYVSAGEFVEDTRLQQMANYAKVMLEGTFIPGGRILANANTPIRNLLNCFVLPIYDSRASIYKSLGRAAEIFACGGGVGYSFSHLREKGALVKGTSGEASGPLSFMSLYNQTGEVISQASRRGAMLGILNCDHPDIEDFIEFKSKLNVRNVETVREFIANLQYQGKEVSDDIIFTLTKTLAESQLTHFNISVGITDEFMRAVANNRSFPLISIVTGKVIKEVNAAELLRKIAESAWASGDPGLFFLDKMNEDNMVPYMGKIEAANPCGEIGLLPYEGCVLGSLNLNEFVEDNYIDFDYLTSVVRTGIRFLDNVVELNHTPVDIINKAIQATRRLGLGVMGWANMLAELGIPYDDPGALKLAEVLGKFISETAWKTSMALAKEKGPFPAWREDVTWNLLDKVGLEHLPVRNVATTAIAPTGTISLLAGVSSGIEPFFAKEYIRNVTDGMGNNTLQTLHSKLEYDSIKTAHDIHWKDHIKMQAEWQRWVDNSISKTINMPETATVDDIINAYTMAWEYGLKGITVYRDKSKQYQILNPK